MERALAGESVRGVGVCRADQPRYGVGHAKKNELKPWLKECWCIAGEASGEYVYHMEDVLEVYTRPYDARFPHICLDEASKQLLAQVHTPLPMDQGSVRKEDYQYERNFEYHKRLREREKHG